VRAATTDFSKALAKEVAPFSIQANVVAPNYLYSEVHYPKGRFVDSAEGRELIARTVPCGRLGRPEEVGALIAFLAPRKSVKLPQRVQNSECSRMAPMETGPRSRL
jgi:3-oxoacyl-[acyl-carrier protein] reductase